MRALTFVLAATLASAGCNARSQQSAPRDEPAAADSQAASAAPRAPAESRATGAREPALPGALPASVDVYREVTLPAGTRLPLRLETTVASDTSSIEDTVKATLREGVLVDGALVLTPGTDVSGVVTAQRRSGKVQGRGLVAFRFTTLTLDAEPQRIRTAVISREARGTKAKDARTIGIPAAGGAAVGALIGGKKGAAIGGAAGGGAGTAVVLSTRGEEVRLPAGTNITARLTEPLTVRVPATTP